jgi:hypothetical protein
MRILHMTIKKKWFDQIAAGVKPEEFREIKPYWAKRLEGKQYDRIIFRNGYSLDSPSMAVEYHGYTRKVITWESGVIEEVFALRLGKVLNIKN